MTRFLLIRHASTDSVGERISSDRPGIELNETGRREAARLADRLRGLSVDAVYASPYARAWETAAILGRRLRVEPSSMDAFGEVHYGDWSGKTLDALEDDPRWRHYNQFRSGTRIPGGEMIVELQSRAVAAIEDLEARHRGRSVAVVSHADVLRTVIAFFCAIPLDLCRRIELAPASLSILEIEEWDCRLTLLNMAPFWEKS